MTTARPPVPVPVTEPKYYRLPNPDVPAFPAPTPPPSAQPTNPSFTNLMGRAATQGAALYDRAANALSAPPGMRPPSGTPPVHVGPQRPVEYDAVDRMATPMRNIVGEIRNSPVLAEAGGAVKNFGQAVHDRYEEMRKPYIANEERYGYLPSIPFQVAQLGADTLTGLGMLGRGALNNYAGTWGKEQAAKIHFDGDAAQKGPQPTEKPQPSGRMAAGVASSIRQERENSVDTPEQLAAVKAQAQARGQHTTQNPEDALKTALASGEYSTSRGPGGNITYFRGPNGELIRGDGKQNTVMLQNGGFGGGQAGAPASAGGWPAVNPNNPLAQAVAEKHRLQEEADNRAMLYNMGPQPGMSIGDFVAAKHLQQAYLKNQENQNALRLGMMRNATDQRGQDLHYALGDVGNQIQGGHLDIARANSDLDRNLKTVAARQGAEQLQRVTAANAANADLRRNHNWFLPPSDEDQMAANAMAASSADLSPYLVKSVNQK